MATGASFVGHYIDQKTKERHQKINNFTQEVEKFTRKTPKGELYIFAKQADSLKSVHQKEGKHVEFHDGRVSILHPLTKDTLAFKYPGVLKNAINSN